MRSFIWALGAIAAFSTLQASTGHAASVTISTDESILHVSEHGLPIKRNGSFNTSAYGHELIGMDVVAHFVDGSSEKLSWAGKSSLGDRFGGVTGSDFSLTYEKRQWFLSTSKRLASLVVDAAKGNAFFDILSNPRDGTNGDTYGTSFGFPYQIRGGDALEGEIKVTYSNGIVIRGYDRGLDTFAKMSVDYTGLWDGGLLGETIFQSDLDRIAVPGDLTPVPLPAGFPFLAAGLLLLVPLRKRRG